MTARETYVLLIVGSLTVVACSATASRQDLPGSNAAADTLGSAPPRADSAEMGALKAEKSNVPGLMTTTIGTVAPPATTVLLFEPATASAASIEVFNTRTGKLESRAVAVGGTAAACAAAAASAAWALNGNTGAQHLKGYLILTKGQFEVKSRGGGCQFKEFTEKLPFTTSQATVRAYAANSDVFGSWQYDTKSIAIPANCRYLKHGSYHWTANPNVATSDRWSEQITTSPSSNGITAVTVRVGAGTKDQGGAGISLGVHLAVDMECV